MMTTAVIYGGVDAGNVALAISGISTPRSAAQRAMPIAHLQKQKKGWRETEDAPDTAAPAPVQVAAAPARPTGMLTPTLPPPRPTATTAATAMELLMSGGDDECFGDRCVLKILCTHAPGRRQ
jgi:hypothetical protein